MAKRVGRVKPGLPGAAQCRYRHRMTPKDERAERLAEALRQNLRRRKTQARERSEPIAPPKHDQDSGAA